MSDWICPIHGERNQGQVLWFMCLPKPFCDECLGKWIASHVQPCEPADKSGPADA